MNYKTKSIDDIIGDSVQKVGRFIVNGTRSIISSIRGLDKSSIKGKCRNKHKNRCKGKCKNSCSGICKKRCSKKGE